MSIPSRDDQNKKMRAFFSRLLAEQEAYKRFLFDHAELLEDLIEQVRTIPNEGWVMTDPLHGVIFVQNDAPYQPPLRGKLAALLVMVLNEERLRIPNRDRREPLAVPTLVKFMRDKHRQLFGKPGHISERTVERVVCDLRRSGRGISRCIVTARGSLGGYYLDTSALQSS